MTPEAARMHENSELTHALHIACWQADDILDRILQLHEDAARPDDALLGAMVVLRNQLDRIKLLVPITTETTL